VVCPQKLDEHNKRLKTDGLDAKALCLKLDRFVQGNRDALALVRVPTEEEERSRAIHRQREQLAGARKRLEAQGRSLMVNHGLEPVQNWWKLEGPVDGRPCCVRPLILRLRSRSLGSRSHQAKNPFSVTSKHSG
jgi:hypothetical protein